MNSLVAWIHISSYMLLPICVIQVGAVNSVSFSSLRHSEKYNHTDTINYYLRQCIMKFEGITNIQVIADVANQFIQR